MFNNISDGVSWHLLFRIYAFYFIKTKTSSAHFKIFVSNSLIAVFVLQRQRSSIIPLLALRHLLIQRL